MLLPAAKKEKPKSETYKQPWFVSEQHLLERLLSEIPGGKKKSVRLSYLLSRVKSLKSF